MTIFSRPFDHIIVLKKSVLILLCAHELFSLESGSDSKSSDDIILILDANSEIGAHERSNPYYFICIRHSIRSGAVTNSIFSPKRPILLDA